jgi:hypothetical protein
MAKCARDGVAGDRAGPRPCGFARDRWKAHKPHTRVTEMRLLDESRRRSAWSLRLPFRRLRTRMRPVGRGSARRADRGLTTAQEDADAFSDVAARALLALCSVPSDRRNFREQRQPAGRAGEWQGPCCHTGASLRRSPVCPTISGDVRRVPGADRAQRGGCLYVVRRTARARDHDDSRKPCGRRYRAGARTDLRHSAQTPPPSAQPSAADCWIASRRSASESRARRSGVTTAGPRRLAMRAFAALPTARASSP